jgi:hypothetical protein
MPEEPPSWLETWDDWEDAQEGAWLEFKDLANGARMPQGRIDSDMVVRKKRRVGEKTGRDGTKGKDDGIEGSLKC